MNRNHRRLGPFFAVACLMAGVCWVVLPASPAQADLVMPDTPDICAGLIRVAYGAADEKLTATGVALTLENEVGVLEPITSGSFRLNAGIDTSGTLKPGEGTLRIEGTIPSRSFNSGTLLTGNLTHLEFPDVGKTLSFLFQVTGGDAAALYGSSGGLHLHTGFFLGSFLSDFNNGFTFDGTADVGSVIPEPSSAIVWGLLGALGICAAWRRRRKTRT